MLFRTEIIYWPMLVVIRMTGTIATTFVHVLTVANCNLSQFTHRNAAMVHMVTESMRSNSILNGTKIPTCYNYYGNGDGCDLMIT